MDPQHGAVLNIGTNFSLTDSHYKIKRTCADLLKLMMETLIPTSMFYFKRFPGLWIIKWLGSECDAQRSNHTTIPNVCCCGGGGGGCLSVNNFSHIFQNNVTLTRWDDYSITPESVKQMDIIGGRSIRRDLLWQALQVRAYNTEGIRRNEQHTALFISNTCRLLMHKTKINIVFISMG